MIFCSRADQPSAETLRARGAGDGGAVDTAAVDAGPVGHDLLHRERRVLRGRGSDRGADPAARRHGTRSVLAGRRVAGRHRGQPEEGLPVDTQLQDTAGEDRVFREDAEQHQIQMKARKIARGKKKENGARDAVTIFFFFFFPGNGLNFFPFSRGNRTYFFFFCNIFALTRDIARDSNPNV